MQREANEKATPLCEAPHLRPRAIVEAQPLQDTPAVTLSHPLRHEFSWTHSSSAQRARRHARMTTPSVEPPRAATHPHPLRQSTSDIYARHAQRARPVATVTLRTKPGTRPATLSAQVPHDL